MIAKRKGVVARWGLKAAWSKDASRGPQRQVFVAGVGESRDLRLLLPLFASAGNRSLRMAGDTTSRRRALQAL